MMSIHTRNIYLNSLFEKLNVRKKKRNHLHTGGIVQTQNQTQNQKGGIVQTQITIEHINKALLYIREPSNNLYDFPQ